jgi:hypothetical protein
MIEINEKNHTSIIISSLNKVYNTGRMTGRLESTDLYLFNTIYKLLAGCCLDLNDIERKQLMSLYRTMYFHSVNICHTTPIEVYENVYKTPFFQADSVDCNDYPVTDKIYYWQEESINTTIENIISLIDNQGYFSNKPFYTKEILEIGKDINYINIGRICFAIIEAIDTDTYKIYDSMNNDVTHTFDRVYIDSINTILFVSQNFYSHGTMEFKIKKTTDIFDNGIFNSIFNNIFN